MFWSMTYSIFQANHGCKIQSIEMFQFTKCIFVIHFSYSGESMMGAFSAQIESNTQLLTSFLNIILLHWSHKFKTSAPELLVFFGLVWVCEIMEDNKLHNQAVTLLEVNMCLENNSLFGEKKRKIEAGSCKIFFTFFTCSYGYEMIREHFTPPLNRVCFCVFMSVCLFHSHPILTYVTQHGFLWSYNRDALAHKP